MFHLYTVSNNTRVADHAYNCPQHQTGFTLVELMIALVLGLLVTAAALQVFYVSQRTATTQSSASDIQDSSVFGLYRLEQQLRFANLGAETIKLNGDTKEGGIIITQNNATDTSDVQYLTDTSQFSQQDAYASSFGGTKKSDQLTIQFTAPQDMLDCQGSSVTIGTRIIQRYFLRSEGGSLGLACDASTTATPESTVIIPNVDQFKFLLITNNGYKTITEYTTAGATDPIYGLKLGLVIAGATPTIEASSKSISVLGNDYTLPADSTNTIRRVYEPVVILRNARY